MNNISSFESDEEAQRKIQNIILAHLYLKKKRVTRKNLHPRIRGPSIFNRSSIFKGRLD